MRNIDKMKAEIERLKAKYRNQLWSDNEKSKEAGYKIEALNELMLSLPEEKPSEDLEKAALEYEKTNRCAVYGNVDVFDAFIAGAKWMQEQMPDIEICPHSIKSKSYKENVYARKETQD